MHILILGVIRALRIPRPPGNLFYAYKNGFIHKKDAYK